MTEEQERYEASTTGVAQPEPLPTIAEMSGSIDFGPAGEQERYDGAPLGAVAPPEPLPEILGTRALCALRGTRPCKVCPAWKRNDVRGAHPSAWGMCRLDPEWYGTQRDHHCLRGQAL